MGGCISYESQFKQLVTEARHHLYTRHQATFKGICASQSAINMYNTSGLTPLHVSSEQGNVEAVQLLVRLNADVNLATDERHGHTTALLLAATHGHTDCVRVLLEAGASPDAPDDWMNTPLFKASSYNHVQCVVELLRHGASPDIANQWGALPIQYAALQGNMEVVAALVAAGADVNRPGEPDVISALAVASSRGHTDCVELLLKARADVNFEWDSEKCQTALSESVNYFILSAFYGLVDDNQIRISDRLTCICFLLASGARVTPKCFHYFLSREWISGIEYWRQAESESHQYILELLKLLIKSAPLGGAPSYDNQINDIFNSILVELPFFTKGDSFELTSTHIKWLSKRGIAIELFDLMTSVGFKPNQRTLQIYQRQSTVQSLQNLCKIKIRSACSHNVVCAVAKLPIPSIMQEFVASA